MGEIRPCATISATAFPMTTTCGAFSQTRAPVALGAPRTLNLATISGRPSPRRSSAGARDGVGAGAASLGGSRPRRPAPPQRRVGHQFPIRRAALPGWPVPDPGLPLFRVHRSGNRPSPSGSSPRSGEDWFCFAGLWRPMPAGAGEAFTLLTTEPGPDVAPIHDRQMVVLERRDWLAWLDLSRPEAELLRRLPPASRWLWNRCGDRLCFAWRASIGVTQRHQRAAVTLHPLRLRGVGRARVNSAWLAIFDWLRLGLEVVERRDRTKRLLFGDDHVGGHLGQHRRLEQKLPPSALRLPPITIFGPLVDRVGDVGLGLFAPPSVRSAGRSRSPLVAARDLHRPAVGASRFAPI